MSKSKKICTITIIVALCIGSNYALAGLPNFKVMDFFVFISGFIFGPLVGASTGILIWLIYGVINPYGFVPQIWLATMFSEAIYGLAGGIFRRAVTSSNFKDNSLGVSILFGAAGLFLTLVYDLATNIVYAMAFNVPIVIALILGIPFAIVHELSNTILFGVCSIPIINTINQFIGGERIGFFEK